MTLPLYTRFLTPSEYGITAIATSITGFLAVFYALGLIAAYNRYYFDCKDDALELKKHISTITWFLAIYGFLFSLLLVFLKNLLQPYFTGIPFYPYIVLAIFSGYFSIFFQLQLNFLQIERRSGMYSALFSASLAVQTTFTVYAVVFLKGGALGFIEAGLASNVIFSLISLWLMKRHLIICIDKRKLRSYLGYGLPLVVSSIGSWILLLADKLILNNLLGTGETGLYSVGYKMGSTMTIISSSINFAWNPYFFSSMKNDNPLVEKEVARFATYWVAAMCFVFLGIASFAKEIIMLFAAPEFYISYKVVSLVALGYLFNGFYFIAVNPLFWKGKTVLIGVAIITSGLINIILNAVFIPHLRMMGSALAIALSFFYCFIFVAFFSKKYLSFPYEYRRFVKILIATAVVFFVERLADQISGFWLGISVKILILTSFPLLLIAEGFLKKDEKAVILLELNRIKRLVGGNRYISKK